MKKIVLGKVFDVAYGLSKRRETWHVNPFFLTHCYTEIVNGETLYFERDDVVKDTFNLISVPQKRENIQQKCLIYLFKDEIEDIEKKGIKVKSKNLIGPEYFYKTSDFIKMEGPEFSKYRKKVRRFIKDNEPKVSNECPVEKVREFILNWAKGKDTSKMNQLQKDIFEDGVKYSLEYLDYSKEIPSKSYYVEVDGELVGFRLTCKVGEKIWFGIMQKIDYRYKGLNEFLYHISAKDYEDIEYFTTGGAALIESLDQYKTNMHPSYTKDLYFVVTE